MAFDAFLKIDTIQGEATAKGHEGWIELLSWSWGANQPSTKIGVVARGKPAFQGLSITKTLDRASAKLMLACANGEAFPKVVLHVCQADGGQDPFFGVRLSQAMVWTYRSSGVEDANRLGQIADSRPLEEVGFNFGKIEIAYRQFGADGKLLSFTTSGWDLKTSKLLAVTDFL
jgi:type VI secretion system secreted protein Hcp